MDDFPFSEAWLETVAHEKHAINGVLSLGRSDRSSLHLNDASVSRRHAVLHRQPDGEFWLVDLGSVNGTYLNEARIAQPVRLRDGDRITLGSQVFVFRQAEAPPHSTLLSTQATRLDLRAARVWLLLADIVGFTPLSRELAPDRLAEAVGGWFLACQSIIERSNGAIYKYLGDGFLASWNDGAASPPRIAVVVKALVESEIQPRFRFVVHRGSIMKGGSPMPGEEGLMGPVVNFTFRMETLAAELRVPVLFSEEAHEGLSSAPAEFAAGETLAEGIRGQILILCARVPGSCRKAGRVASCAPDAG